MSTQPTLIESLTFLAGHEDATWFDLIEQGLIREGSLLEPEHILSAPVDPTRADLVEEFRRSPLGPFSDELQLLLWQLRAQAPSGRYVLRETATGCWQAVRLSPGRRPRWEPAANEEFESEDDCEWALFALRWRDLTGQELPLRREH
jgi:hypothetical protein